MQLSVEREKLEHLLSLATTIVERRNTMPILANIKISATDNALTIWATDLEVNLQGEIEAQVQSKGTTTVNGKFLYELVRELSGESVSLKVSGSERLEIESGLAKFRVNCVSADEFPAVKGVDLTGGVNVEAKTLLEMIEKTAYAASVDETRYNINGVYAETPSRGAKGPQLLRFVATDGHRMALIEREVEGLSLAQGVIIPRKGIYELRKVLEGNEGQTRVIVDGGFFTVLCGSVALAIRLLDGQFPDYQQIIPKDSKTWVKVAKTEVLAALRRVALMTSDKVRSVKFKLVDGTLVVLSSSPEFGEAVESVTVEQEGENVNIAFSAKYLIELLNTITASDTVMIRLNGEFGPGVFVGNKEEYYSSVVMPMRFE